ncbi:NRAMP family divalent metal transporter [Geomesophilobacter sediminis]|uniref:Divalent metal cation transporter n=1 Tax=Geomesophilobacter sediminis TaxID=2798584 RepID=A0A8J7M1M2_9BACT|nr:divalent metal cation transporter [Geomesophilobacter sediminis]MBJ6726819.1 divalent metal cation transporter [Geomesophilobacter sediminis]
MMEDVPAKKESFHMGKKKSATNQDNQTRQGTQKEAKKIEVGMVVEADEGDLGQEDITEAKVTDIVHGQAGDVETIVAKKGTFFQKEIEIPSERIQSVVQSTGEDKPGESPGKVVFSASEAEVEALTPVGREAFPSEEPSIPKNGDDLLDQTAKALPTDVGLRSLEEEANPDTDSTDQEAAQHGALETGAIEGEDRANAAVAGGDKVKIFQVLGPGLLSGMAGNDASAVASYSLDGAQNGYGHLWLMLLSTPLLQAVQFASSKIGRIQQKGLAEILREHYGKKLAVPAALLLIIANIALIAADLVAISAGLELITGIRWLWFAPPVAFTLWYVTVYQDFDAIKKIFLAMSMIFGAYIITAFYSKADWPTVLTGTFIPQLDLNFASVSTAVALLGATISPYTIFWQVQGEKEEKRSGSNKKKFHFAAIDIAAGVISGNLIAYFIIVSTAATLFTNHQQIHTALDAARALEPLVGPFAKYLFAMGLIGAGLIAIPVLLASASYGVAGTIGWPSGLSKKPWQNEGFYLILTLGLVVSLLLALIGLDPMQLMFWANVLQGVLSPILVVLLLLIGNNQVIMGKDKLGWLTNVGLVLAALVMSAASVLLFYGLVTGPGGGPPPSGS